jgi:peroxiredoxin Q/BCP
MLSFLYGRPLEPGTPAPDFTLADQDGQPVTLSALRGKNVVLVFYPKDETPVCRKQLCEFRDDSPLAASKDTLVFGVNPASRASHAGFRDNLKLPFPLLVDEGGRVAAQYNCKGLLWPVRTVYLIGRDGMIAFAGRGKPSPREVLAGAR